MHQYRLRVDSNKDCDGNVCPYGKFPNYVFGSDVGLDISPKETVKRKKPSL